jgi:RimJ/RimL family protein N-acetyltransferase
MTETARLVLTAWSETERAPYLEMCADAEVMADYGGPWDAAFANARFERQIGYFARDGFGKWALRLRASGEYLGYCGVNPIWPGLAPAPGLEIGWRMVRRAWGQGYATEAARAALSDAFQRTDAHEVLAYTGPANARSQAVMRRLGMDRVAERDFRYEDGSTAVVFVAPRSRYADGGHRGDA